MKSIIKIVIAAAWFASSTAAIAENQCGMVPENMRARCEEAMRVKTACAGLEGEALKTCQQKTMQYGNTKEDCSKLSGAPLTQCQQHNQAMTIASPCSGKTGADLQSCIREQASKGAMVK